MPPTPTTAVTVNDLRRMVARYLGYNRNYASLSTIEKEDVDEIVSRGLRRFYAPEIPAPDGTPHRWSFLMPHVDLVFEAPLSWTQGAGLPPVSLSYMATSATMTLASGPLFPGWSGDSIAWFAGRRRIAESGTNTSITFSPAPDPAGSAPLAPGDTLVLHHWRVRLPTSIVAFAGSRFRVDGRSVEHDCAVASDIAIEQNASEQSSRLASGWIERIALTTLRSSTQIGTESQIRAAIVWPPPQFTQIVRARVCIAPDLGLDATGDKVPLGGAMHGETITASVLATAEEYFGSRKSEHRQGYLVRLASAIAFDHRAVGVVNHGYNGDGTGAPVEPRGGDHILRLNGVEL